MIFEKLIYYKFEWILFVLINLWHFKLTTYNLLLQVAEFKEAFQLIDHDKDGIIGKNDLRATFDELGRLVQEKELDDMVSSDSDKINQQNNKLICI